MAVVKLAPLVTGLSGKFHGSVFGTGVFGTTIYSNNWKKGARELKLHNSKAGTSTLAKAWKNFTPDQINAWNQLAIATGKWKNGLAALIRIYTVFWRYVNTPVNNIYPPRFFNGALNVVSLNPAIPFTSLIMSTNRVITQPVLAVLQATPPGLVWQQRHGGMSEIIQPAIFFPPGGAVDCISNWEFFFGPPPPGGFIQQYKWECYSYDPTTLTMSEIWEKHTAGVIIP